MAVIVLESQFSRDRDKGTWKLEPHSHGRVALLTCPKCEQTLAVSRRTGFKVSKVGRVEPEVICPSCHSELDVNLKGWRVVRSMVRECYLKLKAKLEKGN